MPKKLMPTHGLLESSQSFERHLHNGDLLTARTHRVPAGRPADGTPPFTWEDSADDALRMKRLHTATDWSLPALLFRMERYNGWGYRRYHQQVLSPYLWSSANHYLRGKYVADGSWSDTAVSRQVGGAALIRRLDERGAIDDLDQPVAAPGPFFHLSDRRQDRVEDLQRFLNTFDGIRLLVDGAPGPRTFAAVEELFGSGLRRAHHADVAAPRPTQTPVSRRAGC